MAHKEIVALLLRHGAEADLRDNRGTSPLYWASANGYYGIVQLLIEHHSDVDVHDDRGWSAKDQAITHRHQSVVELLDAAGAH
ncbi:ankyrin repeat domain-containing protein [Rhodohalobacter sp.]|uniref:ankyrin repeat domain-containing protein n=1 Tax=Rhodohalobacter sp. TaxID=1974210 RepID=UPI002ACEF5A9|nr:ankyrin repeat domain-containing protein [Rhodohalobacter sp.]MDZ7756144.1 ankyrin repeat domain-containing protein [Rhodohalobacter sp.]